MILANINSNISKKLSGGEVILPPEDWPAFDPIDPGTMLFSFIGFDEPLCEVGIIGDPAITWNTPTSSITVKFQIAEGQVSDSVLAGTYMTVFQVPGSDETLGGYQNFKADYFSEFGMTNFIDGNYLPFRILLVDAYSREHVAYEHFNLIVTA